MTKPKKISASLEDYLEAIYLITRKNGEARSKEIMKQLRVSGPSVTEALQVLAEKKMVNYQPYEPITLAPKGKKVAEGVLYRHETLRDFFIEVLGVDRKAAEKGACRMEHVATSNIIERMVKYTDYLKNECKRCGCNKVHCFAEYLQDQKKKSRTSAEEVSDDEL